MLTLITCPTCHHKFPVPESSPGQRRTCPNCESIFIGEKSGSESGSANGAGRRGLLERAAEEMNHSSRPPMDRTMLAEVEAPIKYNCPRCKAALESPTSEGGIKKPCPSCGGRLQVPPAPAPANPALNKTMLADVPSQPIAPSPFAAMAPQAATAGPTLAGTSSGQWFNEHGWKVGVGGLLVVGIVIVSLCFQGKSPADLEQEKALQAQRLELEKLKSDIETKTGLLKQQQEAEDKQHKLWQEAKLKQDEKQRELDRERDSEMRRVGALNDDKLAAETKFRLEQKQRELEAERKKADEQQAKAEQEMRDQLNGLKKQLEDAKIAAAKTSKTKLK